MNLQYSQATVFFPEWFEKKTGPPRKFKEEPGKISGSIVSFTRDGNLIKAKICPYNLPSFLSDDPRVQSQIVKPAIKLVVNDLKTVEDLFEELRKLARWGELEENLLYEKDTNYWHRNREPFKVYDRMGSRGDYYPFEKLLELKQILGQMSEIKFRSVPSDIFKIKEDYLHLGRLARTVNKEEGKPAYVQGKNLRESVEKVLAIYRVADHLKKAFH